MFDISGWEFLTLAALAVMIFGPDRLPSLAADAGKYLKLIRRYVAGAKADLERELGTELPDIRRSDLSARGLLHKVVGEDLHNLDLRKDLDLGVDLRKGLDLRRNLLAPEFSPREIEPLGLGEFPPYDPDTT